MSSFEDSGKKNTSRNISSNSGYFLLFYTKIAFRSTEKKNTLQTLRKATEKVESQLQKKNIIRIK